MQYVLNTGWPICILEQRGRGALEDITYKQKFKLIAAWLIKPWLKYLGPTTITEVRPGMNLCNPSMKKNGYEINMVICEANEICQPLSINGKLAKVGYIVFPTVFKIYIF